MRFSTFLKLLIVMTLFLWVAAMSLWNSPLLHEDFYLLGEQRYLPLWSLLVLVFLAGLIPPSILLAHGSWKKLLEERRRAKGDRTRADIDLLLLDVLEAQLGGRVADTRLAYERILARRPDDLTTLLSYGAFRRESGDPAGALEIHERAQRMKPTSPAPHYEIARDRFALKDPAAAAAALAEAVRLDPKGSVTAARALRDAAAARGDWQESLRWKQALDLRLSLYPDAVRAGDSTTGLGIEYERAVELAAAGKTKDAIASLRALIKKEPKFIPASMALGRALIDSGDDHPALEVYREAYRTTGSPVFLQALEDHHIAREAPIKALEELKAIVARSDRDILPRFALGRLYYRLEMSDEALRELQALAPRVAHSPTLHYILARIHERRGRMREAVDQYRTTIRELGGVRNDFSCSVCHSRFVGWRPRCEKCGSWNSVDIDLEEQKLSAEDLGIAPAPVWGVAAGDFDDTFGAA